MAFAQTKPARESREFRNFNKVATRANVAVVIPDGFKEIDVKSDNPAFDYGITIPDQGFEIWLKVMPQTESTPDSVYLEIGRAQARQLAGDNEYLVRGMPERVLNDYNADAGKTYFFNLPDAAATKRYKFALLITLQKSHKGTIMAVCLTNDKGPDFFRNINRARNCIKFKPAS
ncbi:hypothetical protein HQ865_03960 [Mucilaginibacter mali]|uniref:Uncharacterized protein n=1 Tax=Mucilaginibacter mali TaxID=2740462 RepID=A0A7D4UJD3_9SPHI|nr:hypothetical protein [Mucilaginibacter mali]QKJ28942.1 hypothetical protein HQ865_03960 [Mucilaginibacter mali]